MAKYLLGRRVHVPAPGALSAQDNVVIPVKVHDAASVRCVR
jgi:hypothetical protein